MAKKKSQHDPLDDEIDRQVTQRKTDERANELELVRRELGMPASITTFDQAKEWAKAQHERSQELRLRIAKCEQKIAQRFHDRLREAGFTKKEIGQGPYCSVSVSVDDTRFPAYDTALKEYQYDIDAIREILGVTKPNAQPVVQAVTSVDAPAYSTRKKKRSRPPTERGRGRPEGTTAKTKAIVKTATQYLAKHPNAGDEEIIDHVCTKHQDKSAGAVRKALERHLRRSDK